jgi:hypothetical protein
MSSTGNKKNSKPQPNVKTIDEKHTELLTQFHDTETRVIPELIEEYNALKRRLVFVPESKIDERMEIKDRLKSIKAQIKTMKNQKKEYLLNNSKYIFHYFEDKKKISSGDNNQNANAVNQFFRIKSTNEDESNTNSVKYNQAKIYYQKYWKNVGDDTTTTKDFLQASDKCSVCEKGELIPQDEEGILICNNMNCGNFVMHVVDNSKPSNKEPPNEVSYTAYVKLNHFKEILSQFQAKETTQIPDEVIEQIKARIRKERITDIKTITYEKMREILKTIDLNRYFEHIQYINSILGINPPLMSEELHETLCVLFIEIQRPWAIHCPPDRNNFFNYTYTLYQLCVLLDQTQYLPYIPMMKDRDKQYEQDMIWKKVCDDLDWVFFPTV